MGETTDALLPRQAGDARASAREPRRPRPRRSSTRSTTTRSARSAPRVPPPVGPEAALGGSAIGIKKVEREADAVAARRRAGRPRRLPPARAVRARRHLPRRLRRLRARGRHRRGQPLRPAAVRRGARRRRVHDAQLVERGSAARRGRCRRSTARVLRALGLVRGVIAHRVHPAATTASFYFLETAARVGGAHIVELVEAATGMNLWARVGARMESPASTATTSCRAMRDDYAGLVISLARAGMARHCRLTTTPRSSGGCTSATTSA